MVYRYGSYGPPPARGAFKVSGIILAGGQSSRLGRSKAGELLGGQPLLGRVAQRLAKVASEVIVVVADEQQGMMLPMPAGVRVVTDQYPNPGPLVGMFSGLASAENRWGIVVGCDMPFLNVELLRYMITLIEGFDAVVPLVNGFSEPAHALYSKACLPAMESRLQRGDVKVSSLYLDIGVRYVPEQELRRFDPDLLSFFNVNTEADLEKARALVQTLEKKG